MRVCGWALTVLLAAMPLASEAFAQRTRQRLPGRPPRNAIERLARMTPEQRRRALRKLPPKRRQQLEQRLEKYKRLSPEQRRQLGGQYDSFRRLPPNKQEEARKLFRRFQRLPQDRRTLVRQELRNLRRLSEADHRARMNGDEFRNRFTHSERQLLEDLLDLGPLR
jgi:hypothetical protein